MCVGVHDFMCGVWVYVHVCAFVMQCVSVSVRLCECGCGIAWNRLSSLVLLGCTALMRANSPKHPSGCLQFAQMGERMEEG